ncbi:UDP-galactopyranose mutase [Symbiopectobacterium sp. RP]|uniref:UDP-galactopyranose mutase n=1 Tax=Symbiopectobacterium sp. RP TaxID=3248553 RepID=UPI003D2BA246
MKKINGSVEYDFIIVGSGLFGSICAYELKKKGMKVLVLEKREHIGGNIYTENMEGIQVHKYGAHIFHTNDQDVWDYLNQFVKFNNFVNEPIANFKGKIFNLPFNMNTFYQMWGVTTPKEAKDKIAEQQEELVGIEPNNLEQQAIKLIGRDIYATLIKGYTEKQWGRSATELPPFIINRLPVRFVYNNNYFSDKFQGIPIGGYTKIIEKLLNGIDVLLNEDFNLKQDFYRSKAGKIIYTGPIDQFFNYKFGHLEYRSLKFETEVLDEENYQGNAVVNYTDFEVPFTRIIEHKHFYFINSKKTIISREYPIEYKSGLEPYYPINDKKNQETYSLYRNLAKQEDSVIFGGRLAEYKYYDMHHVVRLSLNLISKL